MNLKYARKNGISDVLLVIVVVFSMALFLLLMVYISNALDNSITPMMDSAVDNTSAEVFHEGINKITNTADYIFLMVFIVFVIGLIITSFWFFSHPIFLVLYLILGIGGLVVSVPLSNAYQEVADKGMFSTAVSHLPILDYIMNNLPLIVGVLIVLSIIIIYSKSRTGASSVGGQI